MGNKQIKIMLYRYLEGIATPEERTLLETWYAEFFVFYYLEHQSPSEITLN